MATLERWKLPWLSGHCYDFALALAELLPQAEFVAVGDPRFSDHVGLKVGESYIDIRGVMNRAAFMAHMAGQPLHIVTRSDVEVQCGLAGVEPPYRGSAEMAAARRAVRRAFPHGLPVAVQNRLASEMPAGSPPDEPGMAGRRRP